MSVPEAIAAAVTEESAWVPRWRRLLLTAVAVMSVVALVVSRLPSAAVVLAVGLTAITTRLMPLLVVARFESPVARDEIRRGREALLLADLVACATALLGVATLGRELQGLAVCGCALAVVGVPHRSLSGAAFTRLIFETVEALSLVALVPLVALGARGWWQ